MPLRAWIYIGTTLLLGAALSVLSVEAVHASGSDWVTWAVLTVLVALVQLFKTLARSKQTSDTTTSYSPFLVFLFAGVLLLPAPLFMLQVLVSHLIEWVKDRLTGSSSLKAWYIQPFNISTHLIAGLVSGLTYRAIVENISSQIWLPGVVAVACAAIVYAVLNHVLIGGALMLARGLSWRESGCLQPENLLPDVVMLSLGGAAASLWTTDPSLILLVVSILALIFRALQVPQLKREAQTDGKTGLLNARRFNELAVAEIERTRRFDRPLAVIMADLDLLRDVNNTYGHLAGDAVLTGIGQVIANTVREYDIAGRFGGEEFAIVLPEVGVDNARAFANRLRQAVEDASFTVATSPTPLKVTMSLGVACYPADGATLEELTHQADVAVYQAKLQGRNRVICAVDVPHFVKLDGVAGSEYKAAFANTEARPQADTQVGEARPAPEAVAATPAPEPAAAATTVPSTFAGGAPVAPLPAPTNHTSSARQQPKYPRGRLGVFLGTVIAMGLLSAVVGTVYGAQLDPLMLVMLMVLAAFGELMQSEHMKGNSTSVTVAIAFAAALIAGLPGAAAVSIVTTLMTYINFKTAMHVNAFNWSTHVLAGWVPVLMLGSLGVSVRASNLALLLPAILGASLVYFVIETGLVTGAIVLSKGGSLVNTWRERFQWLAPHYVVLCVMGLLLAVAYAEQGPLGVIVFSAPVLMMRLAQQQYVQHTKASMQELRRLNGELSQANNEVLAASGAIRKLNDELFLTLAKILDARDPYVSNHSLQVATYAAAIAKELGLPAERIELCRQAGFLHDIGKIGISEQILNKPDKLTAEEYEVLKTHSTIGADLLETSQGLRHLAPFVRGHHEHWDGRGYPDRLRKEQIPLEARILSVCDSVEAMASDRPYKKAKSLDEIVAELRRCSGTQFDPHLTEVFIRLLERDGSKLVVNSALSVAQRQAAARDYALVEAQLSELTQATSAAA